MAGSRQKILMCAPDYFGIDYVINPWMEGHQGETDRGLAKQQWGSLRRALALRADLVFVPPQPGLPDLVFTANAGLVLGTTAVVSRFRAKERQGEEPHFQKVFEEQGFKIAPWPQDIAFEGAGDALFDRAEKRLWVAYGFRSDEKAASQLEDIFTCEVEALHLRDPRFYHLDTCFCPLENGYLMYFPPAFDEVSQKKIADLVPAEKRIAVLESDALKFACNAVNIDEWVYMNAASTTLQDALRQNGFIPATIPLPEFMKSGGAAKCLTLKLIET